MVASRLLDMIAPRRYPCPPPPSAPVGSGVVAGGLFPVVGPKPVAPLPDDSYDGGYLPESDRGLVFGYPPSVGEEPIGSGAGASVVLRTGSKGPLVAQLQHKLKDAGFDPGAADGIFGPRTQAAVKDFQRKKGLDADGVVGPKTLAALEVGLAHRTVKNGSKGQEVRMLQQKLKDAGFDPGPIDGDFGPKTQAAVQAFQRKKDLEADGVVGPKTWGRLGVWQVQNHSSGPSGPSGPAPSPGPGGTVNTPDGQMVRRGGHMISARIAGQFDRMVAAARADGISLQITSGYRSYAEQVVLWNRYGRDPRRVAPPGHSNHQSGTAIDFTNTPGAWSWLKSNAHKFGLHNYPPEPWHYSLNGH